ncbi:cupin domain-containing protein [Streptomyces muensis]|uniref:Cupin domain-containing protein n=1 Tax=Streptomyces muensis TaxID=1077944 RepID=A0A9X1TJ04_STRM4|nr:cupin domain-containing protein [Streptomyces muensis]MCF1592525.1 cupin domain-containing protein [Streptomyces muensis]
MNVAEFPPGMGVDQQEDGRTTAARERLVTGEPGEMMDVDPGMHATDTADICFVISGEVCLALDGGDEEVLRPGDVVVQMGTVHAWRNRSAEPCVVGFAVFGAERDAGA